MGRGTLLSALLTKLKAEVGDSLDATATGKDSVYAQLLSNKQQWLSTEFSWPFLEHRWDVAMVAGTRYYTLPTIPSTGDLGPTVAINLEHSVKTEVQFGSKWQDVDAGIGSQEFNFIDSDAGLTLDPVQRWRLATDSSDAANANKFEVWPVPGIATIFRFTGQRAVTDLVVAGDKADLDDMLLVYFVAAELLARANQKDAQLKANLAQQRLIRLRGSYPVRQRKTVIGGQTNSRDKIRVSPLIAAR